MVSIIAGQKSPSVEKQIAPIREMMGPSSGTAAAIPTEIKTTPHKNHLTQK